MFVAPPEVNQSILDVTGKRDSDIDGYDVVAWSLEQSCLSIERSQPLRVLQGLNYHGRQKTMAAFARKYPKFKDVTNETDARKPLILAFREKEEQRLADLYAPAALKHSTLPSVIESSQNDPNPIVQKLLAMWRSLDFSISEGTSMHEEHEREVAHEVEQETQIQRPRHAKALDRTVDPLLREFVRTGSDTVLQQFRRAYDVVSDTSANDATAAGLFGHLRATTDFIRPARPQSGHYDSYLRPVNWVLTSNQTPKPTDLLLISQYEANQLFDDIHASSAPVDLHSYEPRVTKSMRAVDIAPHNLTYASVIGWQKIPRSLRLELHLFAGQLYFSTIEEYREFLADKITARPPAQAERLIQFIKAWVAIRRKGHDFLPTHVGQMVLNRTLKQGAF